MDNIENIFPFWNKLKESEKNTITNSIKKEKFSKGMIINKTENTCKGLLAVLSGQLRVYILSEEGREITLFRVKQGEICVLSASCLMDSITFDTLIEAAENTEILIIPSTIFKQIIEHNPYVELYLYKATTEKFSDVMWTMQQILFLKIDKRIAQFLWDEMINNNSLTLHITHEEIAKYIGSAREVVTKVLKYLSQENIIELKRGIIKITSKEKLQKFLQM